MKDKGRKKVGIIPHSRPTVGKEEASAAAKVVRSGHIAQGEVVRKFEKALAKFIGVKDAVAVNSGTSALHLGLVAMGMKTGDEVILPSYVCSAPLNAVYHAGATPVLCDIELESLNISLESMRNKKTPSAKAVIVPHMFGSPADLEKIEELGIPIIEDCAHSIGAMYGRKRTGSIGRFSILSFYANKMMACGEGGALLSDDHEILKTARDLRDYDEKDDYKVRYNYKMSDILASVGLIQLKKLPAMIKARKRIAAGYSRAFKGMDVALPRGEFDHIYYRYVVRIKRDVAEMIGLLSNNGVRSARPVFSPLHRSLGLVAGFRNTDEAYATSLSIPIYPSLTGKEQKKVIKAIKECLS